MPSVFTRIVRGEIPCHKIAETEDCLAFLDINPLADGHTLVIPKQEVDVFFDLSEDAISGLMALARRVAHAIECAVPCNRIGVSVIGLEVPHAHVHLIPINELDDMNFARPKLKRDSAQLQAMAERIRTHLSD